MEFALLGPAPRPFTRCGEHVYVGGHSTLLLGNKPAPLSERAAIQLQLVIDEILSALCSCTLYG